MQDEQEVEVGVERNKMTNSRRKVKHMERDINLRLKCGRSEVARGWAARSR